MGKAELPPFGSQHHMRGVAVHLRELGHHTFADNCEAAAKLIEHIYAERDAARMACMTSRRALERVLNLLPKAFNVTRDNVAGVISTLDAVIGEGKDEGSAR
jgi:hypothetical protein